MTSRRLSTHEDSNPLNSSSTHSALRRGGRNALDTTAKPTTCSSPMSELGPSSPTERRSRPRPASVIRGATTPTNTSTPSPVTGHMTEECAKLKNSISETDKVEIFVKNMYDCGLFKVKFFEEWEALTNKTWAPTRDLFTKEYSVVTQETNHED